jgi:hypothetical protein
MLRYLYTYNNCAKFSTLMFGGFNFIMYHSEHKKEGKVMFNLGKSVYHGYTFPITILNFVVSKNKEQKLKEYGNNKIFICNFK